MSEAVFWENWTELAWGAFPYAAYNYFLFLLVIELE
jgi:hypothetical protein